VALALVMVSVSAASDTSVGAAAGAVQAGVGAAAGVADPGAAAAGAGKYQTYKQLKYIPYFLFYNVKGSTNRRRTTSFDDGLSNGQQKNRYCNNRDGHITGFGH
jgi:outer membrane scaffolding protein for murein synthesis (MipA/OmpV family)